MLIGFSQGYAVFYLLIFILFHTLFTFRLLAYERLISYYEEKLKHLLWCCINVVFIIVFFDVNLWKVLALLLFLSLIYATIKKLQNSYFVTLIISVASVLLFFKLLHLVLPEKTYLYYFYIIGVSYLILKLIHFIFESHNKLIDQDSLLSFLNYLLFFPVFSSGPITVYQDFISEIKKKVTVDEAFHYFIKGTKRIILGLFKLYFLSQYTELFSFFNLDAEYLQNAPLYLLILYAYISVFDLYLNFSGYCDLAIGLSNLFCIDIPENFNYPFSARNLHIFWQRWHMTLSNWLKAYIFMPVSKAMFSIKILSNKIYLVQPIAIFITFSAMGAWHGLESNYLIYGLFQGFGLFVVLFFDYILKKRKLYSKYHEIKVISIVSWFLTINYFAISLLLFNANNQSKLDILWSIVAS